MVLACIGVVLSAMGLVACSSDAGSTQTTSAPPNIVMPNLIGMYWTDADPKLRSLGWTGFLVRGPDVHSGPDSRYRVLFQSPSAGQRVDRNGGITVRFGS